MFTAAAALQFIQIKMHKSGRRRRRIEEMTQGWQLNDDRGIAGGGSTENVLHTYIQRTFIN